MERTEKEIDLMRVIYFNYKKTKELSLSKRQVETIGWLKGRKSNAREYARKFDISIQNASQQLSNLHKKGYLDREEKTDDTGGYFFEYTSLPRLFECVF